MSTHTRLNTTHRQVVWECLHMLDVSSAKLAHEYYRLAHVYRDGLTDKEYAYLMQRHHAMEEETQKLVKLKDRLKGTLNGRR